VLVRIEVLADADAVAAHAARWLAAQARAGVAARGRFTLAVSGGSTPWAMLRRLAGEDVPWRAVHLFQVDERVAPSGHRDRNLTHVQECLLSRVALPAENVHAMPAEDPDLEGAADRYARLLAAWAGTPPVLDVVHLGLGADGHTASLVPGDPALDLVDEDVAVTRPYQGRVRMTLTYPALDRARALLWLVTGAAKAAMLGRLRSADASIPAGRVRGDRALLLADAAAAGESAPRP
jgi:6-phosphogluconolactonase